MQNEIGSHVLDHIDLLIFHAKPLPVHKVSVRQHRVPCPELTALYQEEGSEDSKNLQNRARKDRASACMCTMTLVTARGQVAHLSRSLGI